MKRPGILLATALFLVSASEVRSAYGWQLGDGNAAVGRPDGYFKSAFDTMAVASTYNLRVLRGPGGLPRRTFTDPTLCDDTVLIVPKKSGPFPDGGAVIHAVIYNKADDVNGTGSTRRTWKDVDRIVVNEYKRKPTDALLDISDFGLYDVSGRKIATSTGTDYYVCAFERDAGRNVDRAECASVTSGYDDNRKVQKFVWKALNVEMPIVRTRRADVSPACPAPAEGVSLVLDVRQSGEASYCGYMQVSEDAALGRLTDAKKKFEKELKEKKQR